MSHLVLILQLQKKIMVAADASSYGVVQSCMQLYSTVPREVMFKFSVKLSSPILLFVSFVAPLPAIFKSKIGIPVHTVSRLQQYPLMLLTYDFRIRHVNTKSFGMPISFLVSLHYIRSSAWTLSLLLFPTTKARYFFLFDTAKPPLVKFT